MAHVQWNRPSDRLLRGEILGRWSELTHSDVEECVFDRSRLIDVLQARYGFAKRRAEKEVDLFLGDFDDRLRLAA